MATSRSIDLPFVGNPGIETQKQPSTSPRMKAQARMAPAPTAGDVCCDVRVDVESEAESSAGDVMTLFAAPSLSDAHVDKALFLMRASGLYFTLAYMICIAIMLVFRVIVFRQYASMAHFVPLLLLDGICSLTGAWLYSSVGKAVEQTLGPLWIACITSVLSLIYCLCVAWLVPEEASFFPMGELACSMALMIFFLEAY
ncbi:hypothetical protein KIPB_011607, partial [Kipferlia bialata]|eukprot:g11607.t1